jgi:hypothetical protein
MAETTIDARHEIDDARAAFAAELDRLGPAARATLDPRVRIKRDPLRSTVLAGGAAFLLLGGPKRLLKRAEQSLLPRRRPRSLLPEQVERTLRRLPEEERSEVEAHLERDFASYLAHEHAKHPPSGRSSLWRTYDLFVGIVGGAAARELVKRFISSAPRDKSRDSGQSGVG